MSRWRWVVLVGVMSGGCDDDAAGVNLGTVQEAATSLRPDDEVWEPQSESLLGTLRSDLDSSTTHLPDGYEARPDGSGLNPSLSSFASLYATAKAADGTNVTLRIRTGGVDINGNRVYDVKTLTAGAWASYCKEGGMPYLLPGSFSGTGKSFRPGWFASFACPAGGAGKAMLWNYTPDLADGRYFQSAVRMARADFCSNGNNNTFDGTPILFSDPDGYFDDRAIVPHSADESVADFQYEAAWATRVTGLGGEIPNASMHSTLFCIKKWRYQTLRPGGCNMNDPRTGDVNYPFCDAYEAPGMSEDEVLQNIAEAAAGYGMKVTFSFSKQAEAGLWEWKMKANDRWLTTEQGFWGGFEPSQPPTEFAQVDDSARYVATVLREAKAGTQPLGLFKKQVWIPSLFPSGGGFYLPIAYRTTSDLSLSATDPSWVFVREVGHVYSHSRPKTVPLFTYRKGNEYRLYTFQPKTPLPEPGWELQPRLEGWALFGPR